MHSTETAYHATFPLPDAGADLHGIVYERPHGLYFVPDDCADGFLVKRCQVLMHGQVQMVAGLYPGLPGGAA